jgi:integrase
MAKRSHGTGQLYTKQGAWYGRWRTSDGRRLNRKLGPVRPHGKATGLTVAEAERAFRQARHREETAPRPQPGPRTRVSDAADSLRRKLAIEGARKSYLQNCESMQRVHIAPDLGHMPLHKVSRNDVEALIERMLSSGLSRKTMRNVVTFLHSVFEHAIDQEWCGENPVRRAARPARRRATDTDPDIQFLTLEQLHAAIAAIPDDVVVRHPTPVRRGRAGPAPPPPTDVLGPVLRVLILAAGMTGLRQSELIGLRWRDIDWPARRVRVRNTYARGEHSSHGKSDLAVRRSVPLADPLHAALSVWRQRTAYASDTSLVFAHPHSGRPLDRTKVTRRFKQACHDAGVPEITFHELRHTFATRMAAQGVPLRKLQEWLGHADIKTTEIYMHYAPDEHDLATVNAALAAPP